MARKITLISFIILFTNITIGQNIKPYLQAAQPNSINISWKTDNGTNSKVEYGLTSTNLSLSTNGSTQILHTKDSDYNTPYHYHNIKLTGLKPNTGYYYKVFSGASDESEIEYFKTPPAIGNSTGKLRFIVLGDHQIINYQGQPYTKFNELVQASKKKAEELYGTPLADHFNLIVNDGDQVDLGKLQHYEEIHFEKTSYITPNLPLITAVGNHETYGSSYQNGGIQAYYDHFILDNGFTYGGINSNTERYYAYQIANVLFIVLDTELTTTAQKNWAENVINYAKTDNNVEWIISIGHRPYQAEQYSNDFSPWYGNEILPKLKTTDKFVLHIGGHHHMYARGQFKDHNGYHIISGGTAWPQYWGDSNNEDDREETQGSWSNFAYQFIEFDNDTEQMTIQSYTIGSLTTNKDNELLDEVRYKKGVNTPEKPAITNNYTQSVNLPITLNSTNYRTTTSEDLNSTQFQVSSTPNFSILELDSFRHVDNYYGPDGTKTDETVNIGEGKSILNYTIPENFLNNGTFYARVRHRDKNLGWSPWSDSITFEVDGSLDGEPGISINKASYALEDPIKITFLNGPGNNTDWIGIYKENDVPGTNASTTFQYVNGDINGIKTFNLNTSGIYFTSFFINDGYQEITERQHFWVGAQAALSSNKTIYDEGDDVIVNFTDHPNNTGDWIGIYKAGTPIGNGNETMKLGVNTTVNSLTFGNLPKAYYYAVYHVKDSYLTSGNFINFQIGTEIAVISTKKTTFSQGEPITIDFIDAPGIEKDYIGIIIDDGNPAGTDNLWTYKYFGGLANGTTTITDIDYLQGSPNQLPVVGDYYLAMFTNDSYTQVSNAIPITITNNTSIYMDDVIVNQNETFDINFLNAPGNTKDWIGLYLQGQTPINVTSQGYKYTNGEINGYKSFTLNNGGNYFASLFENDGYNELTDRVSFTVRLTPVLTTSKSTFLNTDNILVNLTSGGLANVDDWIGIYKENDEPSASNLVARLNVTETSQSFNFGTLPDGLYYVTYHTENTYEETGNRVNFQVGNLIATVSTNETSYYVNEPIELTFVNATGDNEDYIAIFTEGSKPANDAFVTFINLGTMTNGNIIIDGTKGAIGDENYLPQNKGNYFAVMIDPTTGDEISNHSMFSITPKPSATLTTNLIAAGENFTVNYANGKGNTADWVGTYLVGETPGKGSLSTSWKYVDPDNLVTGSRELDAINQPGDYFLAFFENDGYTEVSERFFFTVFNARLSNNEFIKEDSKLTIYPNPTTGLAHIKFDGQIIRDIKVFDINAKQIKVKAQINTNEAILNLRAYSNGVYFIKVFYDNTSKTIKLSLK